MQSPLPIDRVRLEGGPMPPVARHYVIRSHRAAFMLRGLRGIVWTAAVSALFGEATPEAILVELRGALADIAARWAGLTREQAMRKERP